MIERTVTTPDQLLGHLFLRPPKRWLLLTSFQHERAESVCSAREIKHGRAANVMHIIGEKRLDEKKSFKYAYF